jgi:acetyl-CoA synthetase
MASRQKSLSKPNVSSMPSGTAGSSKIPLKEKRSVIKKYCLNPNLVDYNREYASFSWEQANKHISYFANGKVNAAYNAIDRHIFDGRRNKVALYEVGSDLQTSAHTFQDLYYLSNQFGNALKRLGVKKGDRVFVYLPRIAELYISTIAIAKIGAVVGPLFSAFGPEALKDRLADSGAGVVITSPELKPKIDQIKKQLPQLSCVVVTGADAELKDDEFSFDQLVAESSAEDCCEPMDPSDPLYLLYTSGTTGKPKGVLHAHGDILGHHMTSWWVLDLKDDDVYWCTADPGWVTGTVYGIFGPWSNGTSCVTYEGRFDSAIWYSIIDRLHVTVWYTAPTALRMLMRDGDSLAAEFSLESLRHICSVGEPLNAEVVYWGMQAYGLPIHDNWWQTETGMQLIANLPCLPIKPGSMGKPLPGVYAAVVDDDGAELEAGMMGRLVIRPDWPAILKQVWKNPALYDEYFSIAGWYFSGDNAWKDNDGYFWFVGRADDVINTSGHRVGPFEVESALIEHPAVAEAGVIGKPDDERGEIIKAFIVLKNEFSASEVLITEIQEFTKASLAAHAFPREIEIKKSLPKTRSGKIMRRLLKAWELGLPHGDTSSLEEE